MVHRMLEPTISSELMRIQKRKLLWRDSLGQSFAFFALRCIPVFLCSALLCMEEVDPQELWFSDSCVLGHLMGFSQWEVVAGDCWMGGREKPKYFSPSLSISGHSDNGYTRPWFQLLPGKAALCGLRWSQI